MGERDSGEATVYLDRVLNCFGLRRGGRGMCEMPAVSKEYFEPL